MVLSDRSIKAEIEKGRIVIQPLDPLCIQPASVDVHLHRELRVFSGRGYGLCLDPRIAIDDRTEVRHIPEDEPYELKPGEFLLGSTLEYVALPSDIVGRLEGKSSLGRIGLMVHSTAGFVDPGWKGNLTLELSNVSGFPICLSHGIAIGQISFLQLSTPADRPYGSAGLGSKYQGQVGPTPTRYYREFAGNPACEAPGKRRRWGAMANNTALREWLEQSRFGGSVRLFSEELGVSLKTVEEWFYRGAKPGAANCARLYELTQLPQYKPPPPLLKDFR